LAQERETFCAFMTLAGNLKVAVSPGTAVSGFTELKIKWANFGKIVTCLVLYSSPGQNFINATIRAPGALRQEM
jgi:hypothetical protein